MRWNILRFNIVDSLDLPEVEVLKRRRAMVSKRYVRKENQTVFVCTSRDCTLRGALETALEQLGRDGFREVVGGDLNPIFLYSEFDDAQGWSINICAAAKE